MGNSLSERRRISKPMTLPGAFGPNATQSTSGYLLANTLSYRF